MLGFSQEGEDVTDLKGLSVIQHITGMINCINGKVKEGTSWTQVEVKGNKPTLDESVRVSIQVVVHHKACAEMRT